MCLRQGFWLLLSLSVLSSRMQMDRHVQTHRWKSPSWKSPSWKCVRHRVRSSLPWSLWRCPWSLRWVDTSFQKSPSRVEEAPESLKTVFVFIFVSPPPVLFLSHSCQQSLTSWPSPPSVSPLANRHAQMPFQETSRPTFYKEGKDRKSNRHPLFQVPSLASCFHQNPKPDVLQNCCIITAQP